MATSIPSPDRAPADTSLSPSRAEVEQFWTTGQDALSAQPDTSDLRRPCCDTLRRQLHKPDCPKAQTNCPACTGLGAAHLASCPRSVPLDIAASGRDSGEPIASQLKLPNDTCCAGVDVPGVGLVHTYDCAQSERRVLRASRTYCAGAMPETLRRFVDGETVSIAAGREKLGRMTAPDFERGDLVDEMARREPQHDELPLELFIRLMFAARALAEAQIEPAETGLDGAVEPAFCTECMMDEHGGTITHGPACRTGSVLRVIADLCEAAKFNSKEKEAVADGETTRAGDGIRLRGLADRVCLKCGERGGYWDAAVGAQGAEIDLALLGMNQCVGAGLAGEGHILYTHRCQNGRPSAVSDATGFAGAEGGAQ